MLAPRAPGAFPLRAESDTTNGEHAIDSLLSALPVPTRRSCARAQILRRRRSSPSPGASHADLTPAARLLDILLGRAHIEVPNAPRKTMARESAKPTEHEAPRPSPKTRILVVDDEA